MKKYGLLLAVIFLLAGCGDDYSSNPYEQQAIAEGRIRATHAAQTDTAHYATIAAAQTAGAAQEEIDVLEARARATRDALTNEILAAEATETARAVGTQVAGATLAAQGTGTAAANAGATETQISWELTQPALTATIQHQRNLLDREQKTHILETYSPWALVILLLISVAVAGIKTFPWLMLRLFGVRDYNGKPVVIIPAGRLPAGVDIADLGRSYAPGIHMEDGVASQTGMVDPALQMPTTARAQATEFMSAATPKYERPKPGMIRQAAALASTPQQPELPAEAPALPELASWVAFEGFRGHGLPLGIGPQGLIVAEPEASPHLLVAGTTGSGKTRSGLRPAIAAALGVGWQVLIFDRSGLDFLPFRDHPNCLVVRIDDTTRAISYLQAIYAEIQRRFDILSAARTSTWGRLSNADPRILVVFDEFSNLADSLSNSDRENLWRGARMVAAEGRKSGVHLMLALQDPTHRSLDLRIRRNMIPLAFRVRDGDASRVILNANGAETLGPRQFITYQGQDLVRGVAFAPSDRELEMYLDSRPVTVIPAPDWLESSQQQNSLFVDPKTEEILDLHRQGLSKNEIQRRVFGFTGGAAYANVTRVIDQYSGSTTSTTGTESPETGQGE